MLTIALTHNFFDASANLLHYNVSFYQANSDLLNQPNHYLRIRRTVSAKSTWAGEISVKKSLFLDSDS